MSEDEKKARGSKDRKKNENTDVLYSLLLLGSLLSRLGDLAGALLSLVDRLDDTDGNSLSHVTDSETTKRWVGIVLLNTHWLARHELGNASITRLDELWIRLDRLTRSTVDLLDELGELASNVGGVAIEHGGVTGTDLTRMVENDDLGVEGRGLLGRIVLRVRSDVTATNILDRDVLDVEADVITGQTFHELLVVHFDGLHFGGDANGSESNNHAGLDDTSFNTANWYRANTADLVHILKWETEGLVGRTDWRLDGVDGVEEGLALNNTTLGLLCPALVPWHVRGLFQHVVTVPT